MLFLIFFALHEAVSQYIYAVEIFYAITFVVAE